MTRNWGRMATYPKLGNSQFSLHEESAQRGHMGTHPIRCGFMFPPQTALTLGQVVHATLGRTLRGRRGIWPFWAKRLKFAQSGHSKNCISVSQER